MTRGPLTYREPQGGRPARVALAWLAVGFFWLVVTRNFHPTFGLAIIVTASLISAYAVASCANLYRLVPQFRDARRHLPYWGLLWAVMALLTALALGVIRISYFWTLGPDPDRDGLYKHYAIDLFGMVVHVAGAALLAWGMDRWPKNGSSRFAGRADIVEGEG